MQSLFAPLKAEILQQALQLGVPIQKIKYCYCSINPKNQNKSKKEVTLSVS